MKSMGHPVRKNRMWYRQKIKKYFFRGRKISKKIFLKSPVKSLVTGPAQE